MITIRTFFKITGIYLALFIFASFGSYVDEYKNFMDVVNTFLRFGIFLMVFFILSLIDELMDDDMLFGNKQKENKN